MRVVVIVNRPVLVLVPVSVAVSGRVVVLPDVGDLRVVAVRMGRRAQRGADRGHGQDDIEWGADVER